MRAVAVLEIGLEAAKCRHCAVRDSALFAGLHEADFRHIHRPIQDVALTAQHTLYRLGERGEMLFTLRSGIIKLLQYLPDGNQRIVRLLKRGDILGMEILVGQPYQHDAIALSDCGLCAIPAPVIEQLGERQPRLYRDLMARWQQKLAEADTWLTEFTTGTARERIARLLLRLTCPDSDQALPLFGREDLGAMIGLTTETVSRTIAELRRQGVLRDCSANTQGCDQAMLRRIADGEE
ncbi:MAG: Crp/Fnr family transcriptional regulator [Candidatus Competibacteraceae bacterium]|nr:Crp/Fnr family transcriptional regulator [Candidatus Competibacteraceae bacterium]